MVRLAALALALCWLSTPALAEVRALLVGVDQYASMQQLRGAANDARDLAGALRGTGVSDVTMLIDHEATIDAFDRAWNDVLGRSAAGDVLFLSFSGHGVRIPESEARTTPDGFEKGFLLQPYAASAERDEILRDEDLYDRFAAATARGIRIFFVADACHAGAAVRGADTRAGSGFRFQRFDTGSSPILVVPEPEKPVVARPRNPDVTVFSATDERLTIQEVVVDNQYRGALSYAVARGLAAAGSPVDAGALKRYVSPLVRVLSGNRQIPQFTVPDEALTLVATAAAAPQSAALPGTPPMIGVSLVGTEALPGLEGATLTTDSPTLIWDAARRQVVDANGDILVSGISPEGLQGAVDARRVIEALRGGIAAQPSDAGTVIRGRTNPDATGFFLKGDEVEIALQPGEFGYATVANVTANGTVQLVYPVAGLDPPGGAVATVPSFSAPVSAPFGTDYVITILSRQPLAELHIVLEQLHDRIDPLAFYTALQRAAASNELRLGINPIFSCEALRSNGQCESMLAS